MKRIFLALVLLCTISFVQAQDIPFIDVGIRGGVNLGSFRDLPDGESNDGMRTGFTAGAFARVKIPLVGLFVQPEIMYTQGGGKSDSVERKVTSIDIPVLIGYNLSLGPIGGRLGLGPVFSNVLSSEKKEVGTNDFVDVKELTNTSLWSAQFGVGVDISKLAIDLRYQLGLTRVFKDFSDSPYLNSIQLTVGYKFL